MELRPMLPGDIDRLDDIDATVESIQYIHVERTGAGLAMQWRLEQRPLREKLIQPMRMSDEMRFLARQIASGADEGLAVVGEHEGALVAMMLARPDMERKTLILEDLRVDY